jgi:arylsulfatase A-like enzyme
VLLRADAPNIRGLMARGSFTMWAKTTPQSITLPSHVSMLTGVSPDIHGIQWNNDLPLSEPVWPTVPTVFDIAKRAGYTTAIVSGKRKMTFLAAPGTLDFSWITSEGSSEDPEVVQHAVELIRSRKPDLLFVHFPTTDNVGHAVGWGTSEQLGAIRFADECVGKVLAALSDVGRLDDSLIILTSDHGGAGRTHGPDDPRSRSIPWIAAGPGVKRNYDLTLLGRDHDVTTYDTFATACYALGLRPPRRVEGRPVVQIFERSELLEPQRR